MGDTKRREIKNEDGSSSSVFDAAGGSKVQKIDKLQSSKLGVAQNFHPNMDPKKLKKMISNQISAKKSKLKAAQYVAKLEQQEKALEYNNCLIGSQIEAYQNKKHELLLEQQALKIELITKERHRVIQEAETDKIKSEMKRLKAILNTQQETIAQNLGLNSSLVSNLFSKVHSALESSLFPSNQAQNGEGTAQRLVKYQKDGGSEDQI